MEAPGHCHLLKCLFVAVDGGTNTISGSPFACSPGGGGAVARGQPRFNGTIMIIDSAGLCVTWHHVALRQRSTKKGTVLTRCVNSIFT